MTDAITAYQEAIDNAYTAHERLNDAIDTLTDAEYDLAYAVAVEFTEKLEAVAYVSAGANEAARKDRRIIWTEKHLTVEQEAVWHAAQEKRDAEAALELARDVRSLERLRLVMLSTAEGAVTIVGADGVSFADRYGVGHPNEPVNYEEATHARAQAAEIAHLRRLLNVANAQGALGRHTAEAATRYAERLQEEQA